MDTGIDNKRTRELSEDELTRLREEVDKYTTEGDLRRFNSMAIRRLVQLRLAGCGSGWVGAAHGHALVQQLLGGCSAWAWPGAAAAGWVLRMGAAAQVSRPLCGVLGWWDRSGCPPGAHRRRARQMRFVVLEHCALADGVRPRALCAPICRLKEIGCYRGRRHINVRGVAVACAPG